MQEPFYSDVPKHPFRIVNLNCVMHVYVCLLVFSCIIIIIFIIQMCFITREYRNTRYNKIAHHYCYYIHCMHYNSTYHYLRYSHKAYAADPLTKMALATDLTRDMLRRLYISFRTLDLGLARWMAINEAR